MKNLAAPAPLAAAIVRPAGDTAHPVHFEGIRKQALDTGRTRLLVAGVVFSLAFLAIAGRLVDLAILKRATEPSLARSTTTPVAPVGRADIVDRNGIVLATSLPVVSLYANPSSVLDPDEAARRLVEVVPDLTYAEVKAKLESESKFVWLRRNLTPQQHYDVNRLGIPGFQFQRAERRVYPHGRTVAHVLGTTDVDGRGISGAERAFDSELGSGTKPVKLAIDVRVQDVVRNALGAAMIEFRAIGAAGVVLDVETGEALAMVSLPDFDANDPTSAVGDAAFNRVTKGVYEMGSTFKLFTTAMALDSGTVGLRDGYDASKPIHIARFTITDYKGKNRWLSVPEILVYSSNIGTAKMALDVGTELQRNYLGNFGMLAPSPIELPEVGAPLVPATWREINTMTISYGHGLAVSPIQLASGVAMLVNGGVLHPATVLMRATDVPPAGRRVLAADTSKQMRDLMRLVVLHGTGKKADAKGYDVGGKTGTADKLQGRGYRKDSRVASFIGAFPVQEPRYVIFAMVDEPKGNARTFNYATGGWVAAPVVRQIVERIAPMAGIRPILKDDLPMPGQPVLASAGRKPVSGGGEGLAAH